MTPLPTPGPVVQAEILFQVDDDTSALTRLFFRYTGGAPNQTAITGFAGDLADAAGAEFAPLMLATSSVLGARAVDLSSDTGAEGIADSPTVGTRTGARLSPGTAVTIASIIRRRYRGGHPRNYLPFGAGADIATNGEWGDTFRADVDDAWSAFISGVLGSGSVSIQDQVNVSYYNGSHVVIDPQTGRARNVPLRRSPPLLDTVTGHVVRPKIGSQRRRNRNS